MRPIELSYKLGKIDEKLKKLRKQREELISTCPHNLVPKTYKEVCKSYLQNITIVHKGDYGHYDPSYDTSWVELTCNICGTRWSVYKE